MKGKSTLSINGLIKKLDEMFPFDWEILRQAGAEPAMIFEKKSHMMYMMSLIFTPMY